MDSCRSEVLPHIFAVLGSIAFLTFLPCLLYFLLMVATNDVGGPLNLILIPCSNLIIASFFTFVIFFPLSIIMEALFRRGWQKAQNQADPLLISGVILGLILALVVVGYTFVINRILVERDVNSGMMCLARFLFLGGVPFLIGGVTYWFFLQASRKFLSIRKDSQEGSEFPYTV